MEPLAQQDPGRALSLGLAAGRQIPLLAQFMIRRIGGGEPGAALELLVDGLRRQDDDASRLLFLEGIADSLRGVRVAKAPSGWSEAYASLTATAEPRVRVATLVLASAFGDAPARAALRELLLDASTETALRRQAMAALVKARDKELPPAARALIERRELLGEAIRSLAVFDDAKAPEVLLAAYESLPPAERRDALATLGSRATYAGKLLDAVEAGAVPRGHLTADLVRQLRNLGDDALNGRIAEVWGVVRDTPAERARMIAHYRRVVSEEGSGPPDTALGRAIFAKTCQQCHTLFEVGGKVGPDLTGSNRANLDYLLSNVLDPGAVMAKEYQPSVIVTADGRVVTGIVRQRDERALTVQTATETVVLPVADIEEERLSPNSMMPDNLIHELTDHQVRSLVAYLASGGQTAMRATAENAAALFNGVDLTGWRGAESYWSVEGGEIVGRSPGLRRNVFLISELDVGDFELELEVKLTPNSCNSGVQFRSQPIERGSMRGYQADIGAGWWGKLYEEHGRALLWSESAEAHVRPGEWNRYRIVARGHHVRSWINDQPAVDLNDPDGALRGQIGLQIHSGPAMEVRFRNLRLTVLEEGPIPEAGASR